MSDRSIHIRLNRDISREAHGLARASTAAYPATAKRSPKWIASGLVLNSIAQGTIIVVTALSLVRRSYRLSL